MNQLYLPAKAKKVIDIIKLSITFALNIIFIFCSFTTVKAQPLTAVARLDTTEMTIGDRNTLHLAIRAMPNIVVKKIDLSALDTLKIIEIIEKGKAEKTQKNNQNWIQQNFVFTSFDSGAYRLPPISVVYDENGTEIYAQTNPLPLIVHTLPIDSTGLLPIKPIIDEPTTWEDWLPLVATIFVSCLLGYAIYYTIKKRRTLPPPPPVTTVIKLAPNEAALQKLRQLEAQQLWQKGELKAYYSELSYILREYFEDCYAFPALEMTSDEILQHFKTKKLYETESPSLKKFFQTTDLVKFAKATPDSSEHEKTMETAKSVIVKCEM